MAVIILGHGVVDSGKEPILVPPGFKLTLYSDFGQPLSIPARREGGQLISDYTKMASVWSTYKPAGYVGEYDVTYNLQLGSEDYQKEIDLAANADWGATVLHVSQLGGSDIELCTGTPRDEEGNGTCPSPALLVLWRKMEEAGTTDQFDADWWNHHCGGIFGSLGESLPDKDLYWVACSGFDDAVEDEILGADDTPENREALFGDRDIEQP